jgi:hypothetical protein
MGRACPPCGRSRTRATPCPTVGTCRTVVAPAVQVRRPSRLLGTCIRSTPPGRISRRWSRFLQELLHPNTRPAAWPRAPLRARHSAAPGDRSMVHRARHDLVSAPRARRGPAAGRSDPTCGSHHARTARWQPRNRDGRLRVRTPSAIAVPRSANRGKAAGWDHGSAQKRQPRQAAGRGPRIGAEAPAPRARSGAQGTGARRVSPRVAAGIRHAVPTEHELQERAASAPGDVRHRAHQVVDLAGRVVVGEPDPDHPA